MSAARPCIISGAPPNLGCACTITTPCFSRSRDEDVASAPRVVSERSDASLLPFPFSGKVADQSAGRNTDAASSTPSRLDAKRTSWSTVYRGGDFIPSGTPRTTPFGAPGDDVRM